MIIIGTPHTHGGGYLLNDDRASGGKKTEADVQCCMHCQKVLNMQAWKQDGGFCGRCHAPVCSLCADKMLTRGCEPFIKQIEQGLEQGYRRAQFAKLAGL